MHAVSWRMLVDWPVEPRTPGNGHGGLETSFTGPLARPSRNESFSDRQLSRTLSLKPAARPHPRSSFHPPVVPPACCHPRTPPCPQTSCDSYFPQLGGAEQVAGESSPRGVFRGQLSAPSRPPVSANPIHPQPLTPAARGHLRPEHQRLHTLSHVSGVRQGSRTRNVPPLNCGTEGKPLPPFPHLWPAGWTGRAVGQSRSREESCCHDGCLLLIWGTWAPVLISPRKEFMSQLVTFGDRVEA